jgi:hypothetical protein
LQEWLKLLSSLPVLCCCCFLWAHDTAILSSVSFSSSSFFLLSYDEKPRHPVRFLYVALNSACLPIRLCYISSHVSSSSPSPGCSSRGRTTRHSANSNGIKNTPTCQEVVPKSENFVTSGHSHCCYLQCSRNITPTNPSGYCMYRQV